MKKLKKSTIFGLIGFIIVIAILSVTIGQHLLLGKLPSLWSFATIHFAGYLFFLLMPVEALVPYYAAVGHSKITLFFLAIITALLGQLINYSIGYLAPTKKVKEIMGDKNYKKTKNIVNKYGKITIFFFDLFPLSSTLVVAFAGMMNFKLKDTLMYSFFGLVLKYAFIIWILTLF